MQESAFDDFARESGSALLRLAVVLTGDRGQAEDLTQAALEVVWRRWATLADKPHAVRLAFARTVLVRTYTRWYRRLWWREVATGALPDGAAPSGTVELGVDVDRALASLPRQWRAIVALRFLDDLNEATVAAIVGCPVGTVKSSTARALARLRTAPALIRET